MEALPERSIVHFTIHRDSVFICCPFVVRNVRIDWLPLLGSLNGPVKTRNDKIYVFGYH